MTDAISLSEPQLQRILTTLESLKSGGVHWEQVISVFASALLGFLVGIGLEYFKSYRENAKSARERSKMEVEQINATISVVGYNIEALLHIAVPFIIPYFYQSHDAYKAFLESKEDRSSICNFFSKLQNCPSLMTIVPEAFFTEVELVESLPFIVRKDPELLKESAWTNGLARTLKKAISDKHRYIDIAQTEIFKGGLNVQQLNVTPQALESISDTQCVAAFQLFQSLMKLSRGLESINATYAVDINKSKLIAPQALQDAIIQFQKIFDLITGKGDGGL